MSMFFSQHARAMLRYTRAMAVVAILAVAAVVLVLLTQDGRGPKVARSPDTEVSRHRPSGHRSVWSRSSR